jgi:hypothetical protein
VPDQVTVIGQGRKDIHESQHTAATRFIGKNTTKNPIEDGKTRPVQRFQRDRQISPKLFNPRLAINIADRFIDRFEMINLYHSPS